MKEEHRRLADDIAKQVAEAYLSGRPHRFENKNRGIFETDPIQVSWLITGTEAAKAGFGKDLVLALADRAALKTESLLVEARNRAIEALRKSARAGRDRDEQRRSGVPSDVKREMADMARAGVTVQEISEEYGYSPPDVRRILKSVKVIAPERTDRPDQRRAPEDVGITGLRADLELVIAEALASGAAPEMVAKETGVPPDAIDAVREAWVVPDVTEAAAEAIEFQRFRRSRKVEEERDLTSEGEVLFYSGAGPDGYRVEIAPSLVGRLTKELDVLRLMGVHGSSTTEYDIVLSNIRRFADRNLPPTDKRFKTFSWKGVRIEEFKGFKARVFSGTYRSVYPNGQEVWRCGLVYCIVKKRDENKNEDLDKAIELLRVWRSWREEQDDKISRAMRGE